MKPAASRRVRPSAISAASLTGPHEHAVQDAESGTGATIDAEAFLHQAFGDDLGIGAAGGHHLQVRPRVAVRLPRRASSPRLGLGPLGSTSSRVSALGCFRGFSASTALRLGLKRRWLLRLARPRVWRTASLPAMSQALPAAEPAAAADYPPRSASDRLNGCPHGGRRRVPPHDVAHREEHAQKNHDDQKHADQLPVAENQFKFAVVVARQNLLAFHFLGTVQRDYRAHGPKTRIYR